MRADPEVTLFHSPQTRSTGALILLEELHAPCTLQPLDLRGRQQQRQPAFLAINPMGKVPTVRHREAVVTEQAAAASAVDPPAGASGTVTSGTVTT